MPSLTTRLQIRTNKHVALYQSGKRRLAVNTTEAIACMTASFMHTPRNDSSLKDKECPDSDDGDYQYLAIGGMDG